MIDINDDILLRKILMQHFISPVNKGIKGLKNASLKDAKSQTCADEIQIEILIKDNVLKEINFEGTACAVATSSADIFFSLIKEKKLEEVEEIINEYKNFLDTGISNNLVILGELIVFKNINKQKNRILCANLAIDVINEILNN